MTGGAAAGDPLQVLVVEDEPIARRRLIRLLRRVPGVALAGEAANADDAVAETLRLRPDLVLLDVQIPGGDGFSVLDRLGADAPKVIFVTAFDQHALRAFDVAAIDYVTKPVDVGRLALALSRAAAANGRTGASAMREPAGRGDLPDEGGTPIDLARADPVIWVKGRNGRVRIEIADISHVLAERDYALIHSGTGSHLHSESIAALERRLIPFGFLRVHRSALVRRAAVTGISRHKTGRYALTLTDGTSLTVGRTYQAALRRAFFPAAGQTLTDAV